MKTLIVASHNPVKLQAALEGFQQMFPEESFQVEGLAVPSGVGAQPFSSLETLHGAQRRAQRAFEMRTAADYWVGIEGGVEEQDGELGAFAWVVVLASHGTGKARTGTFFLPPPVASLVRQGKELGEADDLVFGRNNSKQENGAIGLLTGDVLDRRRFYSQAVILALVPFKNPSLFIE